MKYALLALLVIHGLIHLMGFAKAFDYAALEQLREPISRPQGLLWLAATLLFLSTAGLLAAGSAWWWVPAAPALALSQTVIVASWGDAKFGTIPNVIVLLPALVAALAVAPWSFRAEFRRDIAAAAVGPAQVPLVSDEDLVHLPLAVQRYLRFAGVVGKPRVWNYRVRFRGRLRTDRESPWMDIVADQRSFVEPPVRLFHIEASRAGVPVTAYHRYVGPAATFRVRLASLLTVVDAKGPEMTRSETVTLFNDMCLLAPATLIDPRIGWVELDGNTVRATFTNAGNTVTAMLSFDTTGALADFVSDDRSATADGTTYTRMRWSTPVGGWGEYSGFRLPSRGAAVWTEPSGPYRYAEFEIVSVEYNVTER